jgi:hypothetical protein
VPAKDGTKMQISTTGRQAITTKFEKEDIAKWGQAMFSKGTWFGGATETGYIFVQVP